MPSIAATPSRQLCTGRGNGCGNALLLGERGRDGDEAGDFGNPATATKKGALFGFQGGALTGAGEAEGRRVLVFDAGGKPLGQFGGEFGLVKPAGLAAVQDSDGDTVIVADSAGCQVLAFRVQLP